MAPAYGQDAGRSQKLAWHAVGRGRVEGDATGESNDRADLLPEFPDRYLLAGTDVDE
jgi:hypothetical protein